MKALKGWDKGKREDNAEGYTDGCHLAHCRQSLVSRKPDRTYSCNSCKTCHKYSLPGLQKGRADVPVSANNAVVDSSYPYFINYYWDYGFRAQRIGELIQARAGSIDIPYFQHIHGDAKDLNAELLVPILLQLPLNDSRLEQARLILQDWDYTSAVDSPQAALYNVFWKNLLAETLHDDLPGYLAESARVCGLADVNVITSYYPDPPGKAIRQHLQAPANILGFLSGYFYIESRPVQTGNG